MSKRIIKVKEKLQGLTTHKKIIAGVGLIAFIFGAMAFHFNEPNSKQNNTSKNESESVKNDIEILNNSTHNGYKVLNEEMYNNGIINFNRIKGDKYLHEWQASVAYYVSGAIKETALEMGRSESDVADYFYASIEIIRKDTDNNLKELKSKNSNNELIECEEQILAFIDKVIENYSVDYIVDSKEENEYYKLLEKKVEIQAQKELNSLIEESKETEEIREEETQDTYVTFNNNLKFNIKYGEFVEAIENDGILVIKAKISPSYSNKATINQNNFNVEDIVKRQGGHKYNEIQYWAVADMESGDESKVVSFTISKNVINMIANGNIPGNMIMDYATDVWILPSLRN